MSMNHDGSRPLMSGGSRFPVGTSSQRQRATDGLSPLAQRSFLLRFAEPVQLAKHTKTGATPAETTGHDGQQGGDDDYTSPDYEP